jgi:hypothetical protein
MARIARTFGKGQIAFNPGTLDRGGLSNAPGLSLPPSRGMRDPSNDSVMHTAAPVPLIVPRRA